MKLKGYLLTAFATMKSTPLIVFLYCFVLIFIACNAYSQTSVNEITEDANALRTRVKRFCRRCGCCRRWFWGGPWFCRCGFGFWG
uniref:Secreted protein n=1 Tax=Ascaris lumbricoides TaxID=6252 RepID=A0A0M3IIT4_ASCLU